MQTPQYKIGDRVKVVDVYRCCFSYSTDMKNRIGQFVTIADMEWSSGYKRYAYRIKEDKRRWVWDDTCFEVVPDETTDFQTESMEAIVNFLMNCGLAVVM